MKKEMKLFFVTTVLLASLLAIPAMAQIKMNMEGKENAPTAIFLKSTMQKLWEDNAMWTRNLIFCIVDDLPGLEEAKTRLMQNQDDIGNAIKPYYGEAAGNKLAGLLQTHVIISAKVVSATKAENTQDLDEANQIWFANADEIAVFLSNANPNWPVADMKKMMSDHLKLVAHQAILRINRNYDADVVTYDKVVIGVLEISDSLTGGITKQFPEKFKAVAVK